MSAKMNGGQSSTVQTTEGPLLIIAKPESSKTFILVDRILYLIEHKQIEPGNILVATCTEKAAKILVTRVSNRLQETNLKFDLNEMYTGTIHSLCLWILEEYRDYTEVKENYRVMDQFDQQYMLYQKLNIFLEIDKIHSLLSDSSRWTQSQELLKWINKLSNDIFDIDELLASDDTRLNVLGKCYKIYEQFMIEENALDFSMIQLEALRLLENYPEIRSKFNERFHYLMVDEYHDLNKIQEKVIFLLGGKRKIFV